MTRLTLSLALLLALTACTSITPTPTPPSIPAVGSDPQQTRAYVETAQGTFGAMLPYANEVGKALAARGLAALKSAMSKLDNGMEDVAQVQTDFDTLAKSDQRIIADQKLTIQHDGEKLKTETAKRDAEIARAKGTIGYRVEQWILWAWRIFVALIILHVVCSLLAMFLPPPYGTIAGVVAKIVNPFGWLIWLVSHVQQNAAIRAAESGAASKVFPGAI